jgi:Holliday junction resolvasome RuvABC endonuclease subunit
MGGTRYTVGIDSSPNGTAVARVFEDGSYETTKFKVGDLRAFARMEFVVQAVINWTGNASMVAIEGPALGYDGSAQSGRHENAGLWWQVAMAVAWQRALPLASIAPNTLKMYATGVGTGKKIGVMMALATRFDFAIPDEDQGDALVAAAMAADHLGFAPRELPQTHRRALGSVVWPKPGDPADVSLFASAKPRKAKAPRRNRAAQGAIELLLGPGEEQVPLPLLESVG